MTNLHSASNVPDDACTRTAAQRVMWLCRHAHRQDQADPAYKRNGDRPFDPPLSDRGRAQAAELGERLRGESVAGVFCSPFRRTVETASIAAAALSLPVYVEPGLAEWLRGDWFDGAADPLWLGVDELAALYPQVDASHEPVDSGPSRDEPHEAMLERTASTAAALRERYAGDLLLIGHGASVAGAARGLIGTRGPVGVQTPLCCLVKVVHRNAIWGIEMDGSDVSHLTDASDLHWC